MAFNKKEEEIIRWSLQNGKSPSEIKQAIVNFRATGSPASSTGVSDLAPEESGLQERLADVGLSAKEDITSAIKGEGEFEGQTPIRRGVEATAEAFSVPVRGGFELLPEKVRSGIKKVGEVIKKGFDKVTGKVSETELFSEIGRLEAEGHINPETTPGFYSLKEALGAASATGEITGDILGTQGVVGVTSKATKALGKIAQQSQKVLSGIKTTGSKGIQEATSKALNPNDIMQRVARISKSKQANFQKTSGESVGEYLVNRGIFGNIDEITKQLYRRFTKSKNTADEAIAKLEGTYKPTPVGTVLNELLENEVKVSSPGATSKDFGRVRELFNKYSKEGLTMTEINEVKRLFERNVKLDFLKENNPKGVTRANNLDSAIRKWQFDQASKLGLKNLPEINKETRLARQLLDDLGKEYAGSAGNNAITLTDWVILAGGDPTAVGGFLAKKALSSKGVQSFFAKKLSGEPKVKDIEAVFEAPTIDSYLDFINKIESGN